MDRDAPRDLPARPAAGDPADPGASRPKRRGPLDFRRTVRASIATGGVPLVTHHRPKRPHRTDLVVLCDVSGSVANFAQFTLLFVHALREVFQSMRAFTFVDQVHEVTEHFRPGGDPVEVMERLAAATAHASLLGRTNYGRAFATVRGVVRRCARTHDEPADPRRCPVQLQRPQRRRPAADERRGTAGRGGSTPSTQRNWGTGDSAAPTYGAIVPMVECRNLGQLAEFVHDLAG